MSNVHRTVIALFTASGLLVSGAAFADPASAPSTLCGDHEKDVKKPKDEKKNPNPSALCGGDKKKDVKKPEDKNPNPA